MPVRNSRVLAALGTALERRKTPLTGKPKGPANVEVDEIAVVQCRGKSIASCPRIATPARHSIEKTFGRNYPLIELV